MGSYVPNTSEEQQEMLREIGFDSFEALFSHIPGEVRVKGGLKLPEGLCEMEVIGKMKEIARMWCLNIYSEGREHTAITDLPL